jgi:hypothetical protein
VQEVPSCALASSPPLALCFLDESHSDWSEMASECRFGLICFACDGSVTAKHLPPSPRLWDLLSFVFFQELHGFISDIEASILF